MGDNMKHSEMHKKNLLSVFCAVLDGDNTLQRLIENLSIGHTTIEKACTTLVDRRILSAYKEMKGTSGRPEYNISLCSSHYCVYIEENDQYFSCILIDANQYAIDRFDKQKFVYSVSLEDVIKIEEEYNISLGNDEIVEIKNLIDILSLVEKKFFN